MNNRILVRKMKLVKFIMLTSQVEVVLQPINLVNLLYQNERK
jgi:hypothetical protein